MPDEKPGLPKSKNEVDMKRITLGLVCLILSIPAFAQQFTIGGKYSNYDTDLNVGGFGVDSDRENSLGLILEYRSDRFVVKGQLDHDFESGLGAFDFFDLADYSRDRIEFSAGYGATPFLDIEIAVRIDSLSVGSFFLFDVGDFDMDQEAFGAGITLHSNPRDEFGYFLTGRAYIGNAEFDLGLGADVDTTGLRIEAGLPIRIGDSRWKVIPGVEWERFETDEVFSFEGFEFETNRLVLSFVYTM